MATVGTNLPAFEVGSRNAVIGNPTGFGSKAGSWRVDRCESLMRKQLVSFVSLTEKFSQVSGSWMIMKERERVCFVGEGIRIETITLRFSQWTFW